MCLLTIDTFVIRIEHYLVLALILCRKKSFKFLRFFFLLFTQANIKVCSNQIKSFIEWKQRYCFDDQEVVQTEVLKTSVFILHEPSALSFDFMLHKNCIHVLASKNKIKPPPCSFILMIATIKIKKLVECLTWIRLRLFDFYISTSLGFK